MRRALLIICMLLSMVPVRGNAAMQQRDSIQLARMARLDSLLVKFYATLEHEDNDRKAAEFDFLIASCRDSLTRQHVALTIFDHYCNHNRIMGEEAVAMHIYDEWIATGRVKARDEFEQMNMELFANFNRLSLVGMQAPEIELYKPCGGKMKIPEKGRPSIIFFYDTSCGKCRLESQVMPHALKDLDMPVYFYAIYVGTDRKAWRSFRSRFKLNNPNIRLIHLWDPGIESDYQRMYGVTGTPRLFVTLEDGEIVGRRLEVENLMQIFRYIKLFPVVCEPDVVKQGGE